MRDKPIALEGRHKICGMNFWFKKIYNYENYSN
jgi:hypothetical protein